MESPTIIQYNKVCGRARGYQYGFTCAFHSSKNADQVSEEGSYVSGLSVTHPKPGKSGEREHIWTFAAGFSKIYGYATVNCPRALYPGPKQPEFVGNNYFCDSGYPTVNTDGMWRIIRGPQQGMRMVNGSLQR